jgi:hypothetical protein
MTSGDRKAEKLARKAAQAEAGQRAAEAKRLSELEAKYWASPYGQARSAKVDGDKYFQIEIPIESSQKVGATTRHSAQGKVLTGIEREGWALMQAGFVFRETGTEAKPLSMTLGQREETFGVLWGVYLFRATDSPAQTDEVWKNWT